jgi:gluconolactonase
MVQIAVFTLGQPNHHRPELRGPSVELANVRVVADGLMFPEGPVAMPDGSVVVVEIHAGRLTRIDPDGRKSILAVTGGGPNGAAIGPDGAFYVCNNGGLSNTGAHLNNGGSIQRVDVASGKVETLYTQCDSSPLLWPNDIVFDSTGNFWFTDFAGDAIYYAAPDGSKIVQAVAGATAANGIGLSPDGRTLYWAQTHSRQVIRRRLSDHGQLIESAGYSVLSLARYGQLNPDALLAGLPGARELDSLAVDGAGYVCVGTVIESGISVISPDGQSVELWTLPSALADLFVTNICFGGPDLKTAYITCSEKGRLVACDWPRAGLKLAFG